MRKHIFLDFLSPENHTIYGTEHNLSPAQQIQLLSESLNVAVLLSGDYCFLPPFFALQSKAVREVLLAKSDFLTLGAVQFPIREASLTDFFEKKIAEYEPVKHQYPGLFDKKGQLFVRRFAASIIKRNASVGRHIATRWESGPDEARVWRPLIDELTASEIESLRSVPHTLKASGESVTWLGMQRHLPPEIGRAEFEVNQALQHEYTLVYLEEYNATIITGALPKTTDLLLVAPDLSYDYWAFRRVLTALNLWDVIRVMGADSILRLKFSRGFLDFISLFENVCERAATRMEVAHHFARLYHKLKHTKPQRAREVTYTEGLFLSRQSFSALEIIDEFLFELTSIEPTPSNYLSPLPTQAIMPFEGLSQQESEVSEVLPGNAKNDVKVFISYAHKDNESHDLSKRWLDRLLEHLQPLVMQEQISAWSDTNIETGERWHESIQAQLQNAKVAVLLVSQSFLASKYIRNSELPVLLMNASKGGVTILPIIVRHCLFSEAEFRYPDPMHGPNKLSLSVFQAANPADKPLNSMEEHEQDRVLVSIAKRILRLAQQTP